MKEDLKSIKGLALLFFGRVGEIRDYEKNIYLKSARERLERLIVEIDNGKCPNVFTAKLEMTNIGDEINLGSCSLKVGKCLEKLLETVSKMRESLFISR